MELWSELCKKSKRKCWQINEKGKKKMWKNKREGKKYFMAKKKEGKNPEVPRGGDDFQTMFEESMRSVKPGGVVKGKVVGITATHVMIDVGYKSEGQIPLQEFLDRDGKVQVQVGDEVDVFFDSSEEDNGDIILSRERAENIKIWEE